MSQRDDWKDTGKGLGSAFKGLGKSIVRTAKTGVDKATDWAEGDKKDASEGSESTVFNDGTWRETGKELGGAFKGLGQNIVKTAKRGGEKATDWAERDKSDVSAEVPELTSPDTPDGQ